MESISAADKARQQVTWERLAAYGTSVTVHCNAHLNLLLRVALLLEVALLGQRLQPHALLVTLHVAGRRALGELLAYLLRQALVPALDALRKSSTMSCWHFCRHAWWVLNNQNIADWAPCNKCKVLCAMPQSYNSRDTSPPCGSKGSAHLCAIPQAAPLRAIVIPLVQAEFELKSKVPLKVAAMAQKEFKNKKP